ncbi:glycerophosphodiester phosphodiesterase family protein [Hydrogenimonas sp. SS33]|uniref:glycerophosphodiester phosphodiesterase n=1 Tax=Hydrogenimonas leucolamina TaxID=2954236 RepID=UPI00336BD685
MPFLDLYEKPGLIAGHRGDRSHFPENTMAAFRGALGKCDFIETDIRLTRDLVPVILHDATLKRTSNVADLPVFKRRKPWRVEDFTYEELRDIDFGGWFYEKDPFGTIRSGETVPPPKEERYQPIPTLEELLLFCKTHRLFVNLELKETGPEVSDEAFVEIVLSKIRETETAELVMLSSFRQAYLPLCKEADPTLPTALLADRPHTDLLALLKRLRVDAWNPSRRIVRRKTVRMVREAGYFVNVYVVDDPKERKKLFGWGVNALFTDRCPPG